MGEPPVAVAEKLSNPALPGQISRWIDALSLRTRVMLGVVLVITLTSLGMMALLSSFERNSQLADRQALLSAAARFDANRLQEEIDDLRKNIRFLPHAPAVVALTGAAQKPGGYRAAEQLQNAQSLFSAFAADHPEYLKICYISIADGGRELVCVQVQNGTPVVLTPTQLKEGRARNAFQEALKLKDGEIKLALIHGSNSGQPPASPVLAAATPVFGRDGVAHGVLLIDVDSRYLLKSQAPALATDLSVRFANPAGDYLLPQHAEEAHPGGDHPRRWQDEFPGLQLSNAISSDAPTSLQRLPLSAGVVYVLARPVTIDPLQAGSYLQLIYTFPESVINAQVARVRQQIFIGVAVSALFILLLLLWLVRRTFVPLERLTQAAQAIAAGRYDMPLPTHGAGELGTLVEHFSTMQQSIAVRDAEQRAIIETANDGFWTVELTGRLCTVNEAYARLSGYTREELLGMSVADLDAHETEEQVQENMQLILQKGSFRFETEHRRKDGTLWPVEVNVAWWPIMGGRFFSFLRDISAQRFAASLLLRDREQQEVLRRMLEIVLQGDAVENSLTRVMQVLLSVSWLSLLPKGGIFRMAENGGLRLAVPYNLAPEVIRVCARVPSGHCHCGRAAASGSLQYSAHLDASHEELTSETSDHGHYCLPINSGTRQLGVLMLYLPPETPRDPDNEKFLASVAGIIGTYLLRTDAEMALKAHQQSLEDEVRERTVALQTSEARARALLSTMLDGVAHIDDRGVLLTVNYALQSMFGYEEEELIGRNVSVLMPAPEAAAHDGYLRRYRQTRDGHVVGRRSEVKGLRKDGSTFAIELAVNEMVDDEGSTFIGVIRDMTTQRATENKLQAALVAAQSATQTKGRFLANMSHEIRTPLNAVLGLAQIGMRNGGAAALTFTRIAKAGEHLLGVINDILDVSKIESGKLIVEQRPFALLAAIDRVVSFVTDRAQDKGLTLSVLLAPDLPEWVEGDELRVTQILTNLLSNAVKFTATGEVRLRVARAGDTTVFRVIDSGIGMTEEQVGRLFQAFEQADSSTTRSYGGTGLGLVISLELAHLMGGDITVDSRPGKGSSFIFQLPLPATDAPERTPASMLVGGQGLHGLSVLAADDVEFNRLVLEDFLKLEGAQVAFAQNGREALELLEKAGKGAFDVVLMDVQMPVMDGLEATRRLRVLASGLPVIGLTAHALAEEREKCLAAGMVDVVTKPIDIMVLVEAIRQQVPIRAGASARPAPAAPSPEPSVVDAVQDCAAPPACTASVIDRAALLARFNGRQEFVNKLTASMYEHHAGTPGKLRAAALAGDSAALAFLAHSLRGVSGNLSAQQLHELSRSVESAIRDCPEITPEIGVTIEKLALALEAVLVELAPPAFDEGAS